MVLGRAGTAASAAAVALAAAFVFFRRLSGKAYDGLSSIISFSSKMIAGGNGCVLNSPRARALGRLGLEAYS